MSDANRRFWMPSAWLDEVLPTQRARPSDFLRQVDGQWQLFAGSEYPDDGFAPIDLVEGQEVEFSWCDDLGTETVHVTSAEAWTGGNFIVPEDGDLVVWVEFDVDSMAESVAELVRVQADELPEFPDDLDVRGCAWGKEHVIFVFANGSLTEKGALQ